MNAVVALVAANLRRLRNDRSNVFFLIVLPLLIVFALGTAFGDAGHARLGVVDRTGSPVAARIAALVEGRGGAELIAVTDAASLRDDVARQILDAGWAVTTAEDGTIVVEWVGGISSDAATLRAVIDQATAQASLEARTAVAIEQRWAMSDAQAAAFVRDTPRIARVDVSSVEDTAGSDPASTRAVLAGGELTLFMFLTSLMGSSALLLSRQNGVTRRTLAAPVTTTQVIAGEAISRYLVALLQAAIIIVGSSVLFGVDWRAPIAVAALCAAMALVGCGVAMLLGTLGRSEQQVGAIGLLAGLVLAALGGSMQPLEFFPDTMRTIAFAITPHAWMNDSLWRILVDGAGLADVAPALAVLTAVGVILIALAGRLLAGSIARR